MATLHTSLIQSIAHALEVPDDPQVCQTILDFIPNGVAKVDGVWVRVEALHRIFTNCNAVPPGRYARLEERPT